MANLQFELPSLDGGDPKDKKESSNLKFDLPDVGINPSSASVSVGDRILDSQYDTGTTKENDPTIYRQERQGVLAEFANGFSKAALKVVPSVIQNFAAIADLEDIYNTDKEVGNIVENSMKEIKSKIDEQFPIYQADNSSAASHEYLISQGSNLLESVGSFALTGGALGRGLSMLSNAAKLGQAGQVASGVFSAAALNHAEGKMVASDVYRTTYENLITNGITEDEAVQRASDSYNHVLNINRINIPLNLTSAFAFLRTPTLTRQLYKDVTLKNTYKSIIRESAQEAAEEAVNLVAEREGLRKGQQGASYQYDPINTISDVLSGEGIESMILGAIGGAAQTAATSGFNQLTGKNKENVDRYRAQKSYLDGLEEYTSVAGIPKMDQLLKNAAIQGDIQNKIQDAAVKGDDASIENLKNQLLQYQSLQAFRTGSTNQLVETFKNVQNDPAGATNFGPDFVTKSAQAIQNINKWEKQYQQIENNYDAGIVEDLFLNRTGLQNIKTHLTAKKSELLQYQTEKLQNDSLGVQDSELDTRLQDVQNEVETLTQVGNTMNEEYNRIIDPEYLELKKIQKEEFRKALEQIETPIIVNEEFPSEVIENVEVEPAPIPFPDDNEEPIKFKAKTNITNIAHKSYEQDPATGKDLIGEDGRKVKNKASIDLSSPKIQAGDDLIYRLVPGEDPNDPDAAIEIALRNQPEKAVGYVHRTDWVNSDKVVESEVDKIKAETIAIREAVRNSPNGVADGKITSKGRGIPNFDGVRDVDFKRSLVDAFGDQNPEAPNQFGDSKIIIPVEMGSEIMAFDGKNLTPSSLYNNPLTFSVMMDIPSPNGEKVNYKLKASTLKELGQSDVISTAIESYLDRSEFKSIEELNKFIRDIYPSKDTETKTFKLEDNEGKLRITFGNEIFDEGTKLDKKQLENFLDKAQFRVNKDLLQSTEPFVTYRVFNGKIVQDSKYPYPNYSSYLANKVLKTNFYPETTSGGERVFFAQPNVGIGLDIAPVVVSEDDLVNSLSSGNIQDALTVLQGLDSKYSELASKLAPLLSEAKVVIDRALKSRGRIENGEIIINPNQSQEALAETIIHESIHYLTARKIENYNNGVDLAANDLKAIKSLERLMQNSLSNLPKKQLSKIESYGFTNLQEFVATALSNPEFQALLNDTPYNGNLSIWEKFTQALKNLLGLDIKPGSALEQAVIDSMSLISQNELIPTGSYDLPFTEESTGDKKADEYLKRINDRIRFLQDKKSSDVGLNQDIELKIYELRKQAFFIKDPENIFKIANQQLADVRNRLSKGNFSNEELTDMDNVISIWESIRDIFPPVSNSKQNDTVKKIVGDVSELRNIWLNKTREKFIKDTNDTGGKLTTEELNAAIDINKAAMYTLDGSTSSIALERIINRDIRDHQFVELEEKRKKLQELKKKVDEIGGKKMYDQLLQVDSKGNVTDKLVDEYTSTYYDELAKQKRNTIEGLKWVRANSSIVTTKKQSQTEEGKKLLAQYDSARNNAKRYFEDKYKFLKKEETQDKYDEAVTNNLGKWERQNSPYLREAKEREVLSGSAKESELKSMQGWKYLVNPTPDSKYKDPKYQSLKNNKALFEFHQFVKSTWEEYAPFIYAAGKPEQIGISGVKKSFWETLKADGLSGAAKGFKDKLIGSVTIDNVNDTEYGNLDPETNLPIRRIKNKLIGNNLKPEESSYDLANYVQELITLGTAIKHRSQVEHRLLLGEKLLSYMKTNRVNEDGMEMVDWTGKTIQENQTLSNATRRVQYTLDSYLGGKLKDIEGVGKPDKKGRRLAASKIADSVTKVTQGASMIFNPTLAGVNLAMGTITNINHAAGGLDFNDSEMFSAIGLVAKAAGDKTLRNKIATLMSKYQISDDNANTTNYGTTSILDKGYILQHWTENINKAQLTIAILKNTKVIDTSGNKISLFDAYDKDGEIDNTIAKETGFESVKGFSSRKTIDLAHKIDFLNKMLHGDYSIKAPKLAKKYTLGRALFVFKNWIPRTLENRFGGEKYNEQLGRKTKGRYRSVVELNDLSKTLTNFKDMLALSAIGRVSGLKTSEGLDKVDAANLKLVIRELSIYATMYLAQMIMRGMVEDNEENRVKFAYWINIMGRVQSDLSFYTSPSQLIKLGKDPIAPLRTVTDFINVVEVSKNAVFGEKKAEDVSKAVSKVVPIWRSYEGFKKASEDIMDK